MWPDLPKGVLYTHSFRSHFSLPFNRYSNIYYCQSFNGLLLLRPPFMDLSGIHECLGGPNSPDQADNQQGITTRLASETGHRCSYIWSWKQPELMSFGHINFWIRRSHHFVDPHHPLPSTPIGMLVVLATLWNKLSRGISTSCSLKSPSTEWSWITVDQWRNAHKLLCAFLRYNELNISKSYF